MGIMERVAIGPSEPGLGRGDGDGDEGYDL